MNRTRIHSTPFLQRRRKKAARMYMFCEKIVHRCLFFFREVTGVK